MSTAHCSEPYCGFEVSAKTRMEALRALYLHFAERHNATELEF